MDEPETITFGSPRPPWTERLPRPWRHGVALLLAFAVGVVLGSAVVSALAQGDAEKSPVLRTSVAEVSPWGSSGELAVTLHVTNDGDEEIQIDRASAETTGYALLHAAPRPPDGGPPLHVAPGEAGLVGLTLQPSCSWREPADVMLLLVLGAGGEAGQTVALPVTDLDQQLAERRRSVCEISDRPADYSAELVDSSVPGWANGELLIVELDLEATGRFAEGLDLVELRPQMPGLSGHFTTDRDPEAALDRSGVSGELWLRLTDCGRATTLAWDEDASTHPDGVGLALYVEKPGNASEVHVRRNAALMRRVHRWVDSTCPAPD